jgi:hypothetical protein
LEKAMLPSVNYRFNAITTKIPITFFLELEKKNSIGSKNYRLSKGILSKNRDAEYMIFANVKLYSMILV